MQTPEAESLAGPGQLTILPHEPHSDRRALARLASASSRFSPTVGLEDQSCQDAMLMDISGLAALWGESDRQGEHRLMRAVERWLLDAGFVVSVAVATGASLALAVAWAAGEEARDGDEAFGGRVVYDSASAFERLPVQVLRVDRPTIDQLLALGIETVGSLLTLPRSALPSRFGQELTTQISQLLGELPEPIIPVTDEPAVTASWPFENPVGSAGVIESTVGELINQVCAHLQSRDRGALGILITYEFDGRAPDKLAVPIRLFRPTASAKELCELAKLQTESVLFPARVKVIKVLVGSVAPLDVRQRQLFEERAPQSPHELTKLINRLANRVGYDRVSRVEKRQGVDPRRVFGYVNATDTPAKPYALTDRQAARFRRLPLLLKTGRLRRETVVPDLDGSPAKVAQRPVIRCWGPERVETGWWRGRGFRRDAYWVELDDGSRLWLAHDLRGGGWWSVGELA